MPGIALNWSELRGNEREPLRDSWSCGAQELTDGETFAQPAHHRLTGWTLEANRYPQTLTAFRMTDAARWMRSNEPESASRSPR
jgi:hypothetical protein